MELNILTLQNSDLQNILFCIQVNTFFNTLELVELFHMAHIFLEYDDHMEQMNKADTIILYCRAIQLQFQFFQNISRLHEEIHHYNLFHIKFHNNLINFKQKFLFAFFVHFQYKFYHSLLQQQQMPSMIHMYFDL